ncbi:hypothetical protein OSB04_018058 [Centaurea solstitialis]|uniref:F-box domain-containing protein n=1 Tax=Centaurea solstitialis TaxID=347529 RepID=A0AA38TBN0_9ASTR|nr:hypothetical protein OSB04_018058 [Centaurea solstitialis]
MAPTTIDNFPLDVLSNILIRLPAKPLARIRCVSKPWNTLLSQPSFIKSHLQRYIKDNDEILVVFANGFGSDPELVHGSVNGLICLSYRTSNNAEPVIQIWNRSLLAILTLPSYCNPFGCTEKISIQFGFRFDPKTHDYKVIKFMTPIPTLLILIQNSFKDRDVNLPYENIQVEVFKGFLSNVTKIVGRDGIFVDGHDGHLGPALTFWRPHAKT